MKRGVISETPHLLLVRLADAFRDDPIYRVANSVNLRAVSFYTARTGSRCSRKLWPVWLQGVDRY